jgi:hypothetical protein
LFRFLSRLFMALVALLAFRLLFAAARRVNQGSESPRVPTTPTRDGIGTDKKARPRINPALAEDVPFVEIGSEREQVRQD